MSEIKISKEVSETKEKIKNLNIGQVNELIEELKKDYNIQETAVVQPVAAATGEKPAEKEISNVSVQWVGKKEEANLKEILGVIQKAVKELKGQEINPLGALKLTKKEDKIILENIAKDKAEAIKKELKEKGAEVEIK